MHTDKCNRDRQYTTLQDRGATFARDNGWKRLGNMDRIIHWWFFTYCYIQSIPRLSSVSPEHVSGAGAENGAERARKSDERERDLKKYGGARAGGRGSGAELSGSGAASGLNRPLTVRSNLTMTDFVSYHTSAFCSQFPNLKFDNVLLCKLTVIVDR